VLTCFLLRATSLSFFLKILGLGSAALCPRILVGKRLLRVHFGTMHSAQYTRSHLRCKDPSYTAQSQLKLILISQGGYRAGLTIGHGSSVSVRCELSTNANPIEMSCHKGILTPPSIPCESGLRKSRQELEHATPTPHPKMEHNELDNDHDHHDNSTDEHDDMKMCGPPMLTDGALVYK